MHVAAAGIVTILLEMYNPLTYLELICIIIGSVGLDLDYFFTEKNHRTMPTHFPLLWVPVFLLGIFNFPLFCLGFAALVHLLLDCFDWGLYLFGPFSKKLFFHLIKIPYENELSFAQYVKRMYKNPISLFVEILVSSIFFILVIFNICLLIGFFVIYFIVAGTTFLYVFWLNDFLTNLEKFSFSTKKT